MMTRTLVLASLLVPVGASVGAAETNTVGVRAGGFFPTAGGEFWDDTRDTFTFHSSDLYSGIAGATFEHPFSNFLHVGFNADVYHAEFDSAVRQLTDIDGFPVFHTSRLTMVPLTVDLRLTPGGRFRTWGEGGEYRENRVAPYVGAGIGVNFWQYEEEGDFVDFAGERPAIFYDAFRENGAAFAAHGLVGLAVPLGRDLSLTFEGRYVWSEDRLRDDFAGLGTLDMSGTALFVGASFHF